MGRCLMDICSFVCEQPIPGINDSLGVTFLKSSGVFPRGRWFWIGVGVNLGYALLFNVLFTLAITYLNRKLPPSSKLDSWLEVHIQLKAHVDVQFKCTASWTVQHDMFHVDFFGPWNDCMILIGEDWETLWVGCWSILLLLSLCSSGQISSSYLRRSV